MDNEEAAVDTIAAASSKSITAADDNKTACADNIKIGKAIVNFLFG